jgi:hypothetical protein
MNQTIKRALLVVVGILVVGFVAIQLVPVDRSNPPVLSEPNWDSPQTRQLAERACFDCHSNETTWPWYSYVAPVSWMVARDVQEGRQHVNFSDWEHVRGEGRSAGEMAEVIHGGWMPPANYLSTHPEARLTDAEKDALVQGLRATLSNR